MNTVINTYTLPAYWASALINDDPSGLTAEELDDLESWLADQRPGRCIGCSDDAVFNWYHDASSYGVAAGDCLNYSFREA